MKLILRAMKQYKTETKTKREGIEALHQQPLKKWEKNEINILTNIKNQQKEHPPICSLLMEHLSDIENSY